MKRSTDRILTTHTGSLPRPPQLLPLIFQREAGTPVDQQAFDGSVKAAVAELVAKQRQVGLDVINDGETGRAGYSTYVRLRLSGFDGEAPPREPLREQLMYPEYYQAAAEQMGNMRVLKRPACNGPVTLTDPQAIHTEIAALRAATEGAGAAEVFMNAASPGVIATFMPNAYYPSDEAYLLALGEAMKHDYKAVVDAGFILQLDCPDFNGSSIIDRAEARKTVEMHVDMLNHAVADLPPDRMRLHLCWGNFAGPHETDRPIADILDLVFKARPMGISFEGANPRHGHEWIVFKDVKLPDDKIIIPGVIDTSSNYVEHPELVAQRLERYANLVGKERVLAGNDCGMSTFAGVSHVHPTIVWPKLEAMAEGARIASERLWARP